MLLLIRIYKINEYKSKFSKRNKETMQTDPAQLKPIRLIAID